MRILKFRIWDTFNKKWIKQGWSNGIYQPEYFIDVEGSVRQLNYDSLDIVNDVIVQQFTGLKDKSGREIYEGDIIKDKQNWLYEVKFFQEYAIFDMEVFKQDNNPGYCYNTRLHESKLIEIIGNIFENPELLESKTPTSCSILISWNN